MTAKLTGVVVLEGPDGAGKTTLAHELCAKHDGEYVHRTYWKGINVWDHHVEALQIAARLAHEKLVVIDRLWPSEAIYANVYRKGSEFRWNARAMDRVLLRLGTVNVLCVPRNVEYIKAIHAKKHAAGEEMYSTVEDVAVRYVDLLDGSVVRPHDGDYAEQYSALGGLLARRHRDTIHYDVTVDGRNVPQFMRQVEHRLNVRQREQWASALDPNTPNLLGHRGDAEFLFVGEQVGNLHGWSRWPFFARTHSPEYISRSLHAIKFPEELGAWTNAWDEDNHLHRAWSEKPELKVIALGRKAEKRCRDLRVPVHASLPHPSFARRFNHHGTHAKPYHEQLREVLS